MFTIVMKDESILILTLAALDRQGYRVFVMDEDHAFATEAEAAAYVEGLRVAFSYHPDFVEFGEVEELCAECGEAPDYCQGHGELG